MKGTQEYIFKKRGILFDVVLTIVFVSFMTGGGIYVAPKSIPMSCFFITVGAIFAYFQLYEIKVTRQYNKYDEGKTVLISDDRLTLTWINRNSKISVNNADIEKVEIYEQNSLGKFGKYGYMVIYTNDGHQLLITDFTISRQVYDLYLEKYLSKKPRLYFKKTFNYIDETKFKP